VGITIKNVTQYKITLGSRSYQYFIINTIFRQGTAWKSLPEFNLSNIINELTY